MTTKAGFSSDTDALAFLSGLGVSALEALPGMRKASPSTTKEGFFEGFLNAIINWDPTKIITKNHQLVSKSQCTFKNRLKGVYQLSGRDGVVAQIQRESSQWNLGSKDLKDLVKIQWNLGRLSHKVHLIKTRLINRIFGRSNGLDLNDPQVRIQRAINQRLIRISKDFEIMKLDDLRSIRPALKEIAAGDDKASRKMAQDLLKKLEIEEGRVQLKKPSTTSESLPTSVFNYIKGCFGFG